MNEARYKQVWTDEREHQYSISETLSAIQPMRKLCLNLNMVVHTIGEEITVNQHSFTYDLLSRISRSESIRILLIF